MKLYSVIFITLLVLLCVSTTVSMRNKLKMHAQNKLSLGNKLRLRSSLKMSSQLKLKMRNKLRMRTKMRTHMGMKTKMKTHLGMKSKNKLKMRSKHKLSMRTTHKLSAKLLNQLNNRNKMSGDDSPFIMKGWLKFVAVPTTRWATYVPEKFEINPSYATQFDEIKRSQQCDKNSVKYEKKTGEKSDPLQERDEFGFLNIPSPVHFFFVLTRKTLFVLTARKNDIAKTRKSMEIMWLLKYQLDDATGKFSGGLEDLGNFHEGFCWKIVASNDALWNMCADTMEQKTEWMNALASVMIKGNSNDPRPPMGLPEGLKIGGMSEEEGDGKNKNTQGPQDGKWVLLHDWSECTLACGGGKSFLQQMCMPPKNGGKPCVGNAIVSRECNTQPCPTPEPDRKTGRTLPPIIKMDRISSRLQRYELCVIREGDLNIKPMLANANPKDTPLFPVRVVLNLKTFTIFSTANYETVYKSFDLRYLNMAISSSDPDRCFVLSDKRDSLKKIVELCIMPQSLRPRESFEDARKSWLQDIWEFENKCNDTNRWKNLTINQDDEMAQLDLDLQLKRSERIRDYDQEQREMDDAKRISDTARTAVNAVEKEMRYEQLVLKEEQQREQSDQQALENALKAEQAKQACLERERKRKESVQKGESQKLQTDQKINEIRQNAMAQVNGARESTLARINAMKKAAARKRLLARAKIIEVRSKIASAIFSDNKNGDMKNCGPNLDDESKKQYCLHKLDETTIQITCLNSIFDGWCPICCENEFGDNFAEKRTACLDMCDKESKNLNGQNCANKGPKAGGWTFVPKTNQI